MQEAFVNINDVPTHIMTWGKWIEESFADNEREVIICISGNPGLPGYYTQFLSTLYNNLDARIPVWIIGQAGHDEPSTTSIRKVQSLSGNESKFDLDAQVKHKLEFIKTYVPSNVKVYLISHSIGAWMTLKLLQDPQIKHRLQKCYFLFPTLEKMAVSPNGLFMTRYFFKLFFLLKIFLHFLNILPVTIRIFLISVYFWITSIPKFFIGTTLKILRVSILEKIIFLASEEMDVVKELDEDTVRNNLDLLKLYYGTTDGWVPVKYYDEMKHRFPGIDAELDPYMIAHTFVLCHSVPMAEIVADWIRQERIKAT